MSERQSKATQDKHERILNEIVKTLGNDRCADCNSRNPRWASYSLGVFLCIRCAGIHRKMGTHVSKVKSITMDQWSVDQIDMMRKSGGNSVVNSKINPNPGSHPLPLTADDDHVMERYIRAKWEKRAFMTVSPPIQKASTPAIARLQVLPKRSSSVPTITNDPLTAGLNKLRDLGFRDEERNKQVLIQTQGNMDATMEILTRNATTPQLTTTPVFLTNEQKSEQLAKLGFNNTNSNMDALRRAGGNLDVAITILNETKSILQQQKGFAGQANLQQQQLRSNSVPVSSSNFLIDVESPSINTIPTYQNPFGVHPQQQQNMQQMQQMQQQQQLQQLQQQQQQQLQMQQQQQMMMQQSQVLQQQNIFGQPQQQTFNNPFGLPSPGYQATPQIVNTPSSNPFSQLTASPFATNNNNSSYFQPTTQQQQHNSNNPWSSTGNLF